MAALVSAFQNGSLVQFLIVTTLTFTVCFLVINDRAIPPSIENPYLLVLGFYFGTKLQSTVETYRRANLVRYDE